jgi:hypothetical protein
LLNIPWTCTAHGMTSCTVSVWRRPLDEEGEGVRSHIKYQYHITCTVYTYCSIIQEQFRMNTYKINVFQISYWLALSFLSPLISQAAPITIITLSSAFSSTSINRLIVTHYLIPKAIFSIAQGTKQQRHHLVTPPNINLVALAVLSAGCGWMHQRINQLWSEFLQDSNVCIRHLGQYCAQPSREESAHL